MHQTSPSVGLYIHIPFCTSKCTYCTFNSFPDLEHLHSRYVRALCLDMQGIAKAIGAHRVDTVYVGGGTPTVLQPLHLRTLLSNCRVAFNVADDAEITVEANPGTVDLEKLEVLLELGVNRLSVGVQSLLDDELKLLGRIHCAAEARAAIGLARRAGFENINVDLIYGLPGRRTRDWQTTLEQAISLSPEHFSLYALCVDTDTPLGQRIGQGLLPRPEDDVAAQMYSFSVRRLARAGYEQYELSNWAATRPARSPLPTHFRCRHNLKYWQREPYIGIGAGAHSFRCDQRWSSLSDPEAYCEALEQGLSPIEHCQTIGPIEGMAETVILGLRLSGGVTFAEFERRHGCDLRGVYADEILETQQAGLLTVTAEGIGLTTRGRLLGNQVFVRFYRTDYAN